MNEYLMSFTLGVGSVSTTDLGLVLSLTDYSEEFEFTLKDNLNWRITANSKFRLKIFHDEGEQLYLKLVSFSISDKFKTVSFSFCRTYGDGSESVCSLTVPATEEIVSLLEIGKNYVFTVVQIDEGVDEENSLYQEYKLF